ncbi:hypothetical protein BCR43DRAFT_512933 [Syncephalastrum racemosum]|uniref:Uncharacterized protein n=1 Tax=Syncephalastrum racemosum TaxID=13706 RepID=A0A1X2HI96_SYNRA|nr:hypothetical protein BCR43DRAFT_512933 [Syncephalastrum racemosum]
MARTRKAKQISVNPGFKPKPLSFKREGPAAKKVNMNKKNVSYEDLCNLQQQAFKQKLTSIIRSIKTTKRGIDARVVERVTQALTKKKQQLIEEEARMPIGTLQLADELGVISTSSTKRPPTQEDNDRKDPQFNHADIPLRSCTTKICQVLRQEVLQDTELLHHVHSKFQGTMQHLSDEIHDVGVITEATMIKFATTGLQRQFHLHKFTNKTTIQKT